MSISNLPAPDQLALIRQQIKDLQEQETKLRNRLIEEPGERTGHAYLAEVREVEQTRTDIKEMRAMYPKIVEEFTFKSPVMRVELRGISADGEIVSTRKRRQADG
jgi:predicted phage-related endonuclease